jgi:hypothetical protein
MKSAKFFIAFTFLLAFAFQVSAQNKTPKIVWKNLQEKYERFQDIKPVIVNKSDKPVFFYEPFYAIKLAYFDESKNEWVTNYPFICGTGLKLTPLKLVPQSNAILSLNETFWKLNSEARPTDIDPLENLRETGIGKFRLELNYGMKKSQITETAVSPDFQVKIINNN